MLSGLLRTPLRSFFPSQILFLQHAQLPGPLPTHRITELFWTHQYTGLEVCTQTQPCLQARDVRGVGGKTNKNHNSFAPFSLCLSALRDFLSWERSTAVNTEPAKQERPGQVSERTTDVPCGMASFLHPGGIWH